MKAKINFKLLLILVSLLSITTNAKAEALKPTACTDVNGFLNQINIVSVINTRSTGNLEVNAILRNNLGEFIGGIQKITSPGEKFDILVNDIGLLPDTIGQLCIITDAVADGEWTGSITLYKVSEDSRSFGDKFDWALYKPISNPRTGKVVTSVNTNRVGMDPGSFVANWISVGDATPGDGNDLKGTIEYKDGSGQTILSKAVVIADGGLAAFGPHANFGTEQVGTVTFEPQSNLDQYYATNARYYYDCRSGECKSFYNAKFVPTLSPIKDIVNIEASTLKGETTVIELVNSTNTTASVLINMHRSDGVQLNSRTVNIPPFGTSHQVINSYAPRAGVFPDTVATANLAIISGNVIATSHSYQTSRTGILEYAYSSPPMTQQGTNQVAQFNSFIKHANELQLTNLSSQTLYSDIGFFDFNGNLSWLRHAVQVPSFGSKRINVMLPRDTYGTVLIKNSHPKSVARVYTSRHFQYTIPVQSSPSNTILPDISGEYVARYIKIMPFGDSITESDNGQTSYRYWLYKSLIDQGIGVDFVGSRYGVKRGQPKYSDFDQDHQGQSGARADVMLDKLNELIPEYTPDIFLIHLGSNDIFQGYDIDSTIKDLENIVYEIRNYNPIAVIMIAKIIPSIKDEEEIAELSRRISELQYLNSTSSPLYIVDQFSDFSTLYDLYDDKHPDPSGDKKIAGNWFNSIIDYLFT